MKMMHRDRQKKNRTDLCQKTCVEHTPSRVLPNKPKGASETAGIVKNAECVPPRGAGRQPREKKWRFCGAFIQNLRETHGVPHTDRTVSMRRDRMRGAACPSTVARAAEAD